MDNRNSSRSPMEPKVSILVPVYNAEMYLEEALDSLRNQTISSIEIICINDGSTDQSGAILEQAALKDERIKIISQSNGGYGKAMNSGLAEASGEYIGILEPDDYVWTGMYERLYEAAIRVNADISQGDTTLFYGDGSQRVNIRNRLSKEKDDYGRAIKLDCERFPAQPFYQTWSAIYRRQMIVENSIKYHETPGAMFQDAGFWFQAFSRAKIYILEDAGCYFYRRDNASSSTNQSVTSNVKAWGEIRELELTRNDLIESNATLSPYMTELFWNRYCRGVYSSLWLAEESQTKTDLLRHAKEVIQSKESCEFGIKEIPKLGSTKLYLFLICHIPRFFALIAAMRFSLKRASNRRQVRRLQRGIKDHDTREM